MEKTHIQALGITMVPHSELVKEISLVDLEKTIFLHREDQSIQSLESSISLDLVLFSLVF